MRSHLFDTANAEVQTEQRWAQQSSKMLKATLGPDVVAAKGAMVAYQGEVRFDHKSAGGLGKFVRRAVTSEDAPLMTVSGHGEVFFARRAEDIFLVQLEGDALSVNGINLLALDATLDVDVHRVQGAGMMAGGMFNTVITGQGTVAVTSDGPPMLLDCSGQATYVDVQAAVAWSASLRPKLVSSMNMKSMLRGGSGEAFQYSFSGPGFVVVQPSEGQPLGGGDGGQQGGLLGNLLNG